MRKRCPACLGYGRINGMGYIPKDCPTCNVTGFVEVEEVKDNFVSTSGIITFAEKTDPVPKEIYLGTSSVGDEGIKTRKKRKDAGMPKQRRTPVKSRIKVDERNQPVGVVGQEV